MRSFLSVSLVTLAFSSLAFAGASGHERVNNRDFFRDGGPDKVTEPGKNPAAQKSLEEPESAAKPNAYKGPQGKFPAKKKAPAIETIENTD